MSVSAEDKERLYRAMVMVPVEDRSVEAILRVLDELGWGPGGVSARPDRTALVAALHAQLAPGHHPDWDLSVTTCGACEHLADALLAADHLWATPDAAQPLAERANDPEQKAGASLGSQGDAMGHPTVVDATLLLDTLAESGLSPDDEATQQLAHILAAQVAAHDALLRSVVERESRAAAWDECLDAIEQNELNTEQARSGNPYRSAEGGSR